jgi:AcrR family transcriptional regulator
VVAGQKVLCKTNKKKALKFLRFFCDICDYPFEAYSNCRLLGFSVQPPKTGFTKRFTKVKGGFTLLPVPFPAKTSTDAIIHSAAEIIRSGGLASLSMRNLAARLGVRASSLYRHFPDRAAIERTLATRAAEHLLDCMQQAAQGAAGERAIFAAARAYLDYATSESAFYEILMQSYPPPVPPSATTKPVWEFFVRIVSEMTQLGDDVSGAAALWSFLHGFTILSRAAQIGETAPRLTFARGTQALVRGLSVPDAEAARSPS